MRPLFGKIPLITALLFTALVALHFISFARGGLAGAAERVNDEGYRALSTLKAEAPVMVRIIDTKGPINLLTPIDIILLIAEIVLLVFIIDWIIKFARRRIRDARILTPYETACKELSALKIAAAKKTISPWECCARISAILKRYMKDALKMGTSEFTTADFLKTLRGLSAASDDILKTVSELLSLCDLVKFSGYDLSQKDLEAKIESADGIIKSLHIRETEDKGAKKP